MAVLPEGITAANIPIINVLELLDGSFSETATAVANGEYVLWLGSGISRDRVDDLGKACLRVVTHLWEESVDEVGAGAFSTALDSALKLAGLNATDKAALDMRMPPKDWKGINQLVSKLVNQYSSLLGIVVEGKDDDYLLWEVVDVPGTYARDDLEPDCEHICIAILALEGLLGNVATANWDGLIEKAVTGMSDDDPAILGVCVTKDDFGAGAVRTRLLKFHGCAVRAKQDPDTYREHLVGRVPQIVKWGKKDHDKLMRHELVGLASTNPSLVVGLSVQDFNIKQVFSEGDDLKPHAFPSHPPAYVFAEQDLGMDQEQLLQCVYGSQEYAKHQAKINESAHVPAFAKPLLSALVLSSLGQKLESYARRANAPGFMVADHDMLGAGIVTLRDRVARGTDGDHLKFIQELVERGGKLLSAFRGQTAPAAGKFVGLGVQPVSQIAGDPNLGTTGLPELGMVTGMVGCVANDNWIFEIHDCGALEIDTGSSKRKLFVVANSDAAASLVANGTIDEDNANIIIAVCTSAAVRQSRSPSVAPGRVLNPDRATDLAVRSILDSAVDAKSAVQMFREEAGL